MNLKFVLIYFNFYAFIYTKYMFKAFQEYIQYKNLIN